MKEVFRGELDGSEAIHTQYYPLTGLFMGTALRCAENALAQKEPNDILRDVIISLTFSAMALKAWANEIAEYVFTGKELADFIGLKGKKYKPTEKCSKILSKYILLMKEKNHPPIPDQVKLSLEQLIKTRNSLVHYKLSQSAGTSRTRRLSMTDANDPVKWGTFFSGNQRL